MVSGINIQKTENEYRSPESPSDETTSAETLRYFLYKFRYFYITLPVNNWQCWRGLSLVLAAQQWQGRQEY